LILVGDLTLTSVRPSVERLFGKLSGKPFPPPTAEPTPSVPAQTRILLVDRPDAVQSSLVALQPMPKRSAPDYEKRALMCTALGGLFTSRLNMNLREKHGYSYGASSVFDMRLSAGPFTSAAGVQTDKTGEALKEFFNELNAIREPVPADELARAKNYVALRYPGGFETTGDISRQLENALVYHLPEDYFSTYVQKIQAVTIADVERVAKKYVQPDRFAVVVVGDLAKIEPQIKAQNLGAIKVLTIDDVFWPKP
jgi:zinc protease